MMCEHNSLQHQPMLGIGKQSMLQVPCSPLQQGELVAAASLCIMLHLWHTP